MYNVYNIELLIHVLNVTTAGKRYTTEITGRYVPVTAMGTVSAGTGTVWENRTRGIPVQNPSNLRWPSVKMEVVVKVGE